MSGGVPSAQTQPVHPFDSGYVVAGEAELKRPNNQQSVTYDVLDDAPQQRAGTLGGRLPRGGAEGAAYSQPKHGVLVLDGNAGPEASEDVIYKVPSVKRRPKKEDMVQVQSYENVSVREAPAFVPLKVAQAQLGAGPRTTHTTPSGAQERTVSLGAKPVLNADSRHQSIDRRQASEGTRHSSLGQNSNKNVVDVMIVENSYFGSFAS